MKIPGQMCYTYTAGMINEHEEQTVGTAWKQRNTGCENLEHTTAHNFIPVLEVQEQVPMIS